jgi:DNA-binding response OmpR family regulator
MMNTESAHVDPSVKRILLIEDDSTISGLLASGLSRGGHEVIQERSGPEGLEAALHECVDLVLMDLMIPELDGLDAIKEMVRKRPSLCIIALSTRADRESMLECFGIGVLDYVVKPFDLDLLLARIEACLRRGARQGPMRGEGLAGPLVSTGDVVLDRDARVIRTPTGQATLNRKEHDLLELLLSQPGHLFTREEIVERVWHQRYLPVSRSLDVHVRHLRIKLEACDAGMSLQTVRGIGHRIAPLEANLLPPSLAPRK